jgi:Mn-containing catalase
MTREITHMKAFALALESMKKSSFSIGRIAPTPGLVNQFFKDSTGTGDHGEIDTRGPWNEATIGFSPNLPRFRAAIRPLQ